MLLLSSEKKLCFLLGSALTARTAFRIGSTKHMSWPESTKKPNHVLIVTLIPNFLWPIHKWVIPDRKLLLLNDWGWNCLDFNQKKEEEGKNVKNGKGFCLWLLYCAIKFNYLRLLSGWNSGSADIAKPKGCSSFGPTFWLKVVRLFHQQCQLSNRTEFNNKVFNKIIIYINDNNHERYSKVSISLHK